MPTPAHPASSLWERLTVNRNERLRRACESGDLKRVRALVARADRLLARSYAQVVLARWRDRPEEAPAGRHAVDEFEGMVNELQASG